MDKNILGGIWPEWEIIRRIGSGSYGNVYEARRETYHYTNSAAIKEIRIPQNSGEVDSFLAEGYTMEQIRAYYNEVVNDFVNEIRLMDSLKGNTNIVSVEDYYIRECKEELGWTIFIRMELLYPFTEYVKGRQLSAQEIVKLGMEICSALELCAGNHIIHRDIKPENIFVNRQGSFKLGDFGIARQLGNSTADMTQSGTPPYMAPEIWSSPHYDATVDTYSLGLVLYRLLNRDRFPFMSFEKAASDRGEKQKATTIRMQGNPIPAPVEAPPRLAEVILKACAFHPADRFSSPTEMRAALWNAMRQADAPPQVNPPQNPPQHQDDDETKGVSPVFVVLMVIASVVLLGSVGYLAYYFLHGTDETSHLGETNSLNRLMIEDSDGITLADGHRYQLFDMKEYSLSSWQQVASFCRNKGGYLATINSEEENDALFQIVRDKGYETAFFGYSDHTGNGDWSWEGQDSSYTNWAKKKPDHKVTDQHPEGERYAQFLAGSDSGKWDDMYFKGNTTMFLCEFDS